MANPTIEVPWAGVVFPQKCASCGNPTVEKTVTVKRPTQAYQRRQSTGYLLGGAIGMAIAGSGAGPDKFVQFGVPHCQDCLAQDRKLKIAGWLCLVVGLLAMTVLPVVAAGAASSDGSGSWIAISIFVGLVLVITSIVLLTIASTRGGVTIKAVKDRFAGAVLSFRNPEYAAEFAQVNLPRLVPYNLRAGLPLPVPANQALEIVSQNVDDGRPDAPDTLAGHFNRAMIFMGMQSYSQAVDDLNKVVAVSGYNPLMPDALLLRGQSLLNLSRYQEAATDLDAFIRSSNDRQKVGEAKKLLKQASAYT